MEVLLQGQLTTAWKIMEEGALHWEQWGEQYALYDALSGETHLLPDFSARVLQQLTIQQLLPKRLPNYYVVILVKFAIGHL